MISLQRRYLSSVIGVACGLLVGGGIIGVLAHAEIDALFDRFTGSRVGPATAAASATEPAGDSAVMSLHETPRVVRGLQFHGGDGRPLTLASFRGKVVLLNIWATWCGPCRREMPTLQATLDGPDIEVMALSIDRVGISAVAKFYQEVGIEHLAIYIDESGKAAQHLSAVGLPTTLLIDSEGREIARLVGPAEWDTPEMMAFLRQQLRRKAGALGPGAARKRFGGRADRQAFSPIQPQIQRLANLDLQPLGKTRPLQPQREYYHERNSIH